MRAIIIFLNLIVFMLSIKFSIAQNSLAGHVIYTQMLTPKNNANSDLPFKAKLTFTKTISLYIENQKYIEEGEELNPDMNSANIYRKSNTDKRFYVFIDKGKKIMRSNEFVLARSFLIEQELSKLIWIIKADKKKIGAYLCQKAQVNTRNRSYTVWFSPQIPINAGPWKLWGLPGLILEAHSDDNEVHFIFESISFSNLSKDIEEPKRINNSVFSPESFVRMRREMLTNIRKNLESQTIKNGNVSFELNTFSIDKYPN